MHNLKKKKKFDPVPINLSSSIFFFFNLKVRKVLKHCHRVGLYKTTISPEHHYHEKNKNPFFIISNIQGGPTKIELQLKNCNFYIY